MEKKIFPSSKLTEFTQKAINVFKGCAGIPSLTRAHIFPLGNVYSRDNNCLEFEVEATWTQMEIERGKRVSFTKSYFVKSNGYSLQKINSLAFQSDATQM